MTWGNRYRDGQRSVAHRPRWSVVGAVLVRQWAVFQFLLIPPLGAALLEGRSALAISLGLPAVAGGLAAAIWRRHRLPQEVRRVEAVLSLVSVFVLAILLTTPAYMTLGLGPIDAVFEATSAITTTGFTMIAAPETLPVSAHVLRTWSQWCGGLVIAVAGLAFLMDRGPVAKALGFADFGDEALASSVRTHARALLVAYLAITLGGIVGALLVVPGLVEGPLLALSAISTGGMTPRADSLASYGAEAQVFLIGLGVTGTMSLAFPVLAYRRGIKGALRSSDVVVLFLCVVAGLVVAAGLLLLSGQSAPSRIGAGLLHVLSLQSTTGFTVGPVAGPTPFLILLMVLMAAGGQTGSTAGGIKIDRVRVLSGAVALTIQRLLSPANAVLRLRLGPEIVGEDRVLFAVALAATYVAATILLWIAFTLHGLPAFDSLFDIVAALSTVGAGLGVVGPDLPAMLKLLTVCAMLLGRLEFFGLLVLALPQTWKRRG